MFIFLTSVNATLNNDSTRLEELLLLTAKGDREAFSRLYGLTQSSVYGFALSILKNSHDAEDIMQTAFINIWTSADSYSPNGKPMAWMLTITKNLCFMRLRENKKTTDYDDGKDLYIPSDFDTAKITENKAVLAAALQVLEDDERQILMLHSVSGLKFREIADLLQKPIATVLSKHHRAIKKMKNAVGGDIND